MLTEKKGSCVPRALLNSHYRHDRIVGHGVPSTPPSRHQQGWCQPTQVFFLNCPQTELVCSKGALWGLLLIKTTLESSINSCSTLYFFCMISVFAWVYVFSIESRKEIAIFYFLAQRSIDHAGFSSPILVFSSYD